MINASPSIISLGTMCALLTSCSITKYYDQYGVQACLMENGAALAKKSVIVKTAGQTYHRTTDKSGCLHLAPKTVYKISHMGSPAHVPRGDQDIEIQVQGYHPLSFHYHLYLSETSNKKDTTPLRKKNGVIKIGTVKLDPE